MPNVLRHAVKAHSRTLQRAAGWCIELRRGGTAYVRNLTGVLTTKEYQVFDADLLPWKKTVTDWIIEKCKLDRTGNSGPHTIEAGDQIYVVESDDASQIGRSFIVQPIGQRPCVEPHDDLRVMLVVHTEEQP